MTTTDEPQKPRRGRPPNPVPPRLPAGTFDPPPYSQLDTGLRAYLATVSDPAAKVAAAAEWIRAAIGATMPYPEIEAALAIPQGALESHLLANNTLVLCAALARRAETFAREQQRLLSLLAQGLVRTPAVQSVKDIARLYREQAADAREWRKELMRKTQPTAAKTYVQRQQRLQRHWAIISGSAETPLPITPAPVTVSTDDALTSAKELLPQLQAARAQAVKGHRRQLDLEIRLCSEYIRLRTEGEEDPTDKRERAAKAIRGELKLLKWEQQVQGAWDAHRKTRAKAERAEAADVHVSDSLVRQFLEVHPDAMAGYEGRVTIDLLKQVLPWAQELPSPSKFVQKQIADLRRRLREADFDGPSEGDLQDADPPDEPTARTGPAPATGAPRQTSPRPTVARVSVPRVMSAQASLAADQERMRARLAAIRRDFPCGPPASSALYAEYRTLLAQLDQ